MASSLEETLRPLAPSMPAELISPASLAQIGAIARVLPNALTSFFGFECRLGDPVARADFLLSAAPDPGGSILAGTSAMARLPESLHRHPVWAQIGAFCARWTVPGTPLYDRVENVWLEFDVEGTPPTVPVPSVFFGAAGGIRRHQHLGSIAPSEEIPYGWVTRDALSLLRARAVPALVERELFACFDALPSHAQVFQVGVMLARRSDAVRLCISHLSPEQLEAYLRRIRWPGPVDRLRSLLAFLGEWVDTFVLDIDVGEAVHPKIGLECYMAGYKQPAHEPRWRALLDALVERGLCVPAKRTALLAWPGFERDDGAPDLWPGNLLLASRLLGPRVSSALSRTLHHIKVSFEQDRPLEAKAYLGVGVHWLGARPLQEQQRARI
jgi:hypothetical protein